MICLIIRFYLLKAAAKKAHSQNNLARARELMEVVSALKETIPEMMSGQEVYDPEFLPPPPSEWGSGEPDPSKPPKPTLTPEQIKAAISDTVSRESLAARIVFIHVSQRSRMLLIDDQ